MCTLTANPPDGDWTPHLLVSSGPSYTPPLQFGAESMPPTAWEIRRKFIDFFVESAAHTEVPSSPVVPLDDPTLLFTNAGMNQFKDVFLGQGVRPYSRAVDTQKCIRAGGKHNDLEDVGRDTYHHTFFEMLGNWSFGDYFKEEAIAWAWKLLTEIYGIDPDRLYASYFGGNEQAGLAVDEEARALWLEHLPEQRVLPFGMKDNFWEMGDTGPCGPCSEVHVDRIGGRDAAHLVNADDPDVMEVWNLVFIQFNRDASQELFPLPAKHVDTGMGFERIVATLQDKTSNYDTDLWTPIFDKIRETCDAAPYGGKLDGRSDIAYRIIADHIRCLTAAIADGAMPGAEGRSYVLRRILRRGVRHGRQTFGVEKPFLAKIVPAVVDVLGDTFPEMKERADHVASVINDEEEAFRRTLDRGLELFDDAAAEAAKAGSTTIPAEDAFKLHDTYGFPIDLTSVMAEERELSVDLSGYEKLMTEARERSRSGGSTTDATITIPPNKIHLLADDYETESTDDQPKYAGTPCTATVMAIWDGDNFLTHVDPQQRVAVILDTTPFYGEQGGQVGDTGTLACNDGGGAFQVEDAKRAGDYVLHIGTMNESRLSRGDQVTCTLDGERRAAIQANHTTTHLLNLALRKVVGDGCDQRGSLVAPDRLRFDYAAKGALKPEQLVAIENSVNEQIKQDLTVDEALLPLDDAQKINTVRAVFGEQYPDPVRSVSIGAPVADLAQNPDDPSWMNLSVEFCGGTHLAQTSDASDFVLLSEQALAAGVRRILAITGKEAQKARTEADQFTQRIATVEALDDTALPEAFDQIARDFESARLGVADKSRLASEIEALRKRAKAARKQAQSTSKGEMVERARQIAEEASGSIIVARLDGADRDGLLAAMDTIRGNCTDAAVLLLSADSEAGTVVIVSRVPEPLIKQGLKAGDWVKVAAQACGGGGGGRPDSAQAGGKDPSRADEALEAARTHAESALS